jgi:hypothetical protein
MDGLTIDEMSKKLGIPPRTVERRIQRAGIKPKTKQAIYPHETLDIIKNVAMGRPKKAAGRELVNPGASKPRATKQPAKPKKQEAKKGKK